MDLYSKTTPSLLHYFYTVILCVKFWLVVKSHSHNSFFSFFFFVYHSIIHQKRMVENSMLEGLRYREIHDKGWGKRQKMVHNGNCVYVIEIWGFGVGDVKPSHLHIQLSRGIWLWHSIPIYLSYQTKRQRCIRSRYCVNQHFKRLYCDIWQYEHEQEQDCYRYNQPLQFSQLLYVTISF